MFCTVGTQIYIPTNSTEASLFLCILSPHLLLSMFCIFAVVTVVKWHRIMGWICISQMANDAASCFHMLVGHLRTVYRGPFPTGLIGLFLLFFRLQVANTFWTPIHMDSYIACKYFPTLLEVSSLYWLFPLLCKDYEFEIPTLALFVVHTLGV